MSASTLYLAHPSSVHCANYCFVAAPFPLCCTLRINNYQCFKKSKFNQLNKSDHGFGAWHMLRPTNQHCIGVLIICNGSTQLVLATGSQLMVSLAIQQSARGWELGTPACYSQTIRLSNFVLILSFLFSSSEEQQRGLCSQLFIGNLKKSFIFHFYADTSLEAVLCFLEPSHIQLTQLCASA